jgi:hypothetical protein
MIKLDTYDFENTAKAVYAMNPTVRELYDDWKEFQYWIETMAYNMHETTSWSSAGVQLTAFPITDGLMVRASVSAYTAMKHLDTAMKHVDTAMKHLEGLSAQ